MSRVLRSVIAVLVLASPAVLAGCGPSKSDGEPNPELKTPDVPPAGHGSKDVGKDKKGGK